MKYLNLKNELKEIVVNIIKTKKELKQYQKDHHGYDGGYYPKRDKLKFEFRHKHIAYCFLIRNMKTFDESVYNLFEKPAQDNLPDKTYIQEIINAYYKENVCTCA